MTHEKAEVPSFTLRLPNLSTRRVWVGCYCYSDMDGIVVVVFAGEPRRDPKLDEYSTADDKHVASVWLNDWVAWFGTAQPMADAGLIKYQGEEIGYVMADLDGTCRKVIEIDLTACWGEDGNLCGLDTNADN